MVEGREKKACEKTQKSVASSEGDKRKEESGRRRRREEWKQTGTKDEEKTSEREKNVGNSLRQIRE